MLEISLLMLLFSLSCSDDVCVGFTLLFVNSSGSSASGNSLFLRRLSFDSSMFISVC